MSQIDTFLKGRPSRDSAIPAAAVLSAPERLVGIGFRCWMAGFQTSDIGCWETAWGRALSPSDAADDPLSVYTRHPRSL